MFEISGALSLSETGWPRRKARSRRSAFARFTRYSASDIAPAIATAVVPSREKIFWTTLDPTKNPFEARLSAARTTPSLLRMPTVVVMLNLGPLCGRSGKLIRVPETKSHGWPGRSLETTRVRNLLGMEGPGSMLPRPKHPGDQQECAEDPCGDRHEEPQRVGVHSRRSPADRFRNRVDLDLVIAARRIPDFVAPPVVREDVIQDGSGTVLWGNVGPIHVAALGSHRHRIDVVQADALQPEGDVRHPARIRHCGRNRDRLADVAVGREDLPDGRRGRVKHRVHQRISVLSGAVDQIGCIPETVGTLAEILGGPAAPIHSGIVGPMVSPARIRGMPRIHAGLRVVRLKFVREEIIVVHLEPDGGRQGQTASMTRNCMTVAGEPVPEDRTVGRSFEGGTNPAVRRDVVVGEGEVGGRSDYQQPVRPTPRDGVVIDDRVVRSVEQDSSVRIRNVVPLNLDGVSGVGVDALSLGDAVALDRDERRRIERHSRLAVDGAVLDRDVRGRPNVHAGLAAGRNVLDGRVRCKVKEDAPVVGKIRLDREVPNQEMGASLSDGDAVGRRRIDEPTLDDIRVGGASRAGGDSVRRGEIVVSLDEDGRMLSQNRGRDRRRGESGRAEDEEERKDPERSPGLHPYLPESPPLPRRHPPNSSWVQAVFHDSLRLACQLRPHERYVPAVFIVLVPGAFAGVSGVVPSRRGRTGNRGGPSERGSSFSYPPSAEPSLVRESNRRTDRERALHDPWFSWSSRAISFPAPTLSNACLSEEWQSPDFTTSCVPQSYERSKTQNTGTCQETCRICVSCHGAGRLTR